MKHIIALSDLPSRGRSYPKHLVIKVEAVPYIQLIQISKLSINSLSDVVSVFHTYVSFEGVDNFSVHDLEVVDYNHLVSVIAVLSDSREGFVPNIKCQHQIENPDINYLSSLIAIEKDEEMIKQYKDKIASLPKTRICNHLLTEPITVLQFKFTETNTEVPQKTEVGENRELWTLCPPTVRRVLELEEEGIDAQESLYFPILSCTNAPIDEVTQKIDELYKPDFLKITQAINSFIVNLEPIPVVCPQCNNVTKVVFHLNKLKGYL